MLNFSSTLIVAIFASLLQVDSFAFTPATTRPWTMARVLVAPKATLTPFAPTERGANTTNDSPVHEPLCDTLPDCLEETLSDIAGEFDTPIILRINPSDDHIPQRIFDVFGDIAEEGEYMDFLDTWGVNNLKVDPTDKIVSYLEKQQPGVVVHPPAEKAKKRLTVDTMAQNLVKMEYAVRGQVVIAADKITEELKKNKESETKHPFDHIVYTNIGNPHSVGQKALTWPRQVLALVDLPDEVGVNHPHANLLFPADAIRRAKEIKQGLGGHGSGAYTHSKGAKCFREDVAAFVAERDGGIKAEPEDIFLTNGASAGIMMVLSALIANDKVGTMIPIPQYPIYSATIDTYGGNKVGYYLDETKGWALNMEELERSLKESEESGINVNSFVLINPGNPTGQVLSKDNLLDIVRFCAKHNLVLLADEVYQENVYDDDTEFVSCKKAAHEAGLLEEDAIELISFHSVSKGVFGECGRRGGYMEMVGIDEQVKEQLYKAASACLCSTVAGQVMTSLMVRGPAESDESYESHEAEKEAIFQSLKRRAQIVGEGLNSIPGFSCQPSRGAMYCFPSVKLPKGAIEEAKEKNTSPDTIYALSLLEKTGICVVPASGFGQEEGRYGFRTTFLPEEEEMAKAVDRIAAHYEEFCAEYSD